MTDNEIIKALKVVSTTANSGECAFYSGMVCNCSQVTAKSALDLINRQKAEIERLTATLDIYAKEFDSHYATERAEARKEFAARLKDIYAVHDGLHITIDNLLAEMERKEAE